MTTAFWILLTVSSASFCSPAFRSEDTTLLVIEGGTLIDGTGSPPRPVSAVVIRDGRFLDVVPGDRSYVPPPGARILNARGRVLVPGIWDVHVHLGSGEGPGLRSRLASLLASGVTAVMSTSDATEAIVQVRDRLRSGELVGPRVWTCGYSITPPGGHPGPYVRRITGRSEDPLASRPGPMAGSAEEARQAVRRRARLGVDAIKLIIESGPPFSLAERTTRMSYEVAAAAVEEASSFGLPVLAHVTSSEEAEDAVRAGVRAIVHSVVEDPLEDELLSAMRSRNVGYVTTLSMFEGLLQFTGPDAPWDDPYLARFVEPPVLEQSRRPELLARLEPLVVWARAGLPHGRSNLLRAVDAGLNVALGTDVGNPFVFHGYATHRELGALSAAGLAPERVIRIASLEGARLLGLDEQYGSIEPGKAADLLILDGDPVRDMTQAFRRIDLVLLDGKEFDPADLPLPRR